MTTKDRNVPGEHPLFRAMVIMGGGLAVGCGGTIATADTRNGPDGTPGAGGSGGAGGATILIDGGGASVGGSAGAEPVIECIAAQWNCDGIYPVCVAGGGMQMPAGCSCDPARPKSVADCTSSEAFVCRRATTDRTGQPLAHDVMFDCACLPRADSCSDACKGLDPSSHADYYDCSVLPDEYEGIQSILCGCGWVSLR